MGTSGDKLTMIGSLLQQMFRVCQATRISGHELDEPVTDLCAIATPYGVISIQKWRDNYRMRLNENDWSEWSLQKP